MNVWTKKTIDPVAKGVYVGSDLITKVREDQYVLYDVEFSNILEALEIIDGVRTLYSNVVFCLEYSVDNLIFFKQLNKQRDFLTAIRIDSKNLFEANRALDSDVDFIVFSGQDKEFMSVVRDIRDKSLLKTRIVYDFSVNSDEKIISCVDIGIINDN